MTLLSTKSMAVLLSYLIVIMTSFVVDCTVLRGVPDEQRLLAKIYRNYDNSVRPVYNATNSVVVKFGMSLIQIIDVDEKNQILVTNAWLEHEWLDMRLSWEPADYNQLTVLRIPANKVWLPDIVLYNNADDYTAGFMPSNVMIHHDGRVFWSPPTRLRSSCKVDITYFPFDEQTCWLKFGSWTYDQAQVDIIQNRYHVDQTNYVTNGEWSLVATRVERNAVIYAIGSAVYPDVTVTLHISRRVVYYMLNILLPCVWLNILSLLAFRLPPDSGEKVTLGITVLLSYSVFMLLVAENMPPTSEFVPLIGVYLTISMASTSISIIMTVFVLNIYHGGPNQTELSPWIRRLVLGKLARLVHCRPSKLCRSSHPASNSTTEKKMPSNVAIGRDQELQGNRRLVLDTFGTSDDVSLKRFRRDSLDARSGISRIVERHFDLPDYIPLTSENQFNCDVIHGDQNGVSTDVTPHEVKLLTAVEEIARHFRSFMNKQDVDERQSDIVNEWRQVTLVIDQCLFWIFLLTTFIYTTLLLIVVPLSRGR